MDFNMSDLKFFDEMSHETRRAKSKHPPIHSVHEGYAVLLEEVEEFWDEVRMQTDARSKENMRKELVQVAVVAMRIAEDLKL
jgi:hypothetical protein